MVTNISLGSSEFRNVVFDKITFFDEGIVAEALVSSKGIHYCFSVSAEFYDTDLESLVTFHSVRRTEPMEVTSICEHVWIRLSYQESSDILLEYKFTGDKEDITLSGTFVYWDHEFSSY